MEKIHSSYSQPVLFLEERIKECDRGNCRGIDKEWIQKYIRLFGWWKYF